MCELNITVLYKLTFIKNAILPPHLLLQSKCLPQFPILYDSFLLSTIKSLKHYSNSSQKQVCIVKIGASRFLPVKLYISVDQYLLALPLFQTIMEAADRVWTQRPCPRMRWRSRIPGASRRSPSTTPPSTRAVWCPPPSPTHLGRMTLTR